MTDTIASSQSEQLPFFKDYYSQDDIRPGDKVSVLWYYFPRAGDEFKLERGDMLEIVGLWDDGWGTAVRLDERAENFEFNKAYGGQSIFPSSEIKAFPLVCVCLPQHWKKTIEGDTSDSETITDTPVTPKANATSPAFSSTSTVTEQAYVFRVHLNLIDKAEYLAHHQRYLDYRGHIARLNGRKDRRMVTFEIDDLRRRGSMEIRVIELVVKLSSEDVRSLVLALQQADAAIESEYVGDMSEARLRYDMACRSLSAQAMRLRGMAVVDGLLISQLEILREAYHTRTTEVENAIERTAAESSITSSTKTFKRELESFTVRYFTRRRRVEVASWYSQSSMVTSNVVSETGNSGITRSSYVTANSYPSTANKYDTPIGPVTRWQAHLRSQSLDPSPNAAIDWSGRGQHVEFGKDEKLPLEAVELLGKGATAVVESVKCRRILLVRKMIKCSMQLKREELLSEAKLLDALRHPHIIQLVGTYVQGNYFCILLYPMADCGSLELFLESCNRATRGELTGMEDENDSNWTWEKGIRLATLERFPSCLAGAVNYIHSKNIKHMDIKPKNILVRRIADPLEQYRVYIADFGISRNYPNGTDTGTYGPTSFTLAYCAPEVVAQERRGRAADIYSLGCVFAEIYTVLAGKSVDNLLRYIAAPYHECSKTLYKWMDDLSFAHLGSSKSRRLVKTIATLIRGMLQDDPSNRSTYGMVQESLDFVGGALWACCQRPPEQYECRQELMGRIP